MIGAEQVKRGQLQVVRVIRIRRDRVPAAELLAWRATSAASAIASGTSSSTTSSATAATIVVALVAAAVVLGTVGLAA